MNIELPPEIECSLVSAAKQFGMTTESLVLHALKERLETLERQESNDAWEALLRSVGSSTGISLSDDATSRDHQYD